MDPRAAAERWAAVWARAWPAHDVEAIDKLYARDCHFRSHPFREPQAPRDYVAWAFADEAAGTECAFGRPLVDGDRAAVEWRAVVHDAAGEQTLWGVSLLRFDAAGLVAEQRDAWAIAEGRIAGPPFPGATAA